jgi:hypothetical protein
LVRAGRVPLVGEGSSLGIPAPADFVYFLAPIVALSRDPLVASSAVGAVNAAAVGGTVLLGWRGFSPLVGLAGGLAYAANPWAVFFGRKVWNPEVVAPLTVLLFIALDRAIVGGRLAWAVAAFPIFTIGAQMHASLGVLAPLLLAPAAALLLHRQVRYLVLGIGLSVLSALPYLIYTFQTNWTDIQALRSSLTRPGLLNLDGAARIVGLTGGWDNWYVEGVHLEFLLPGRIASTPGRVETFLLGLGLAVAAVLMVGRRLSTTQRLRLAGVLLWLLLPALLTIRHAVPIYDHYFLFVPPAGALLIGVGIQWLANRSWRLGVLAVAMLVGIASIQTLMILRELDYLAFGYAPGYGPTLAHSEEMAREVVQFGQAAGSQHLAIELEGLDREPIAYLARPWFAQLDLANVGPVGLSAGTDRHTLPEQDSARLLGKDTQLDLRYDDGVELRAASSSASALAGQPVALVMSWVADQPSSNEVAWDVALLDPRGREVARGSGVRHRPMPGDVVVSWFTLAIPSESPLGSYEVSVRLLDRVDGQPVRFVDSAGHPASEWRYGPINVFRQ